LVIEALRKNEVPFIGVLPDGWLFEAYQLVCEDPYFKVVQVTHEGERCFNLRRGLGRWPALSDDDGKLGTARRR